jgi:hypothetical protein
MLHRTRALVHKSGSYPGVSSHTTFRRSVSGLPQTTDLLSQYQALVSAEKLQHDEDQVRIIIEVCVVDSAVYTVPDCLSAQKASASSRRLHSSLASAGIPPPFADPGRHQETMVGPSVSGRTHRCRCSKGHGQGSKCGRRASESRYTEGMSPPTALATHPDTSGRECS